MDQNGKSKHKQNFFEKHDEISDNDYKLEMLWAQKIIHGKLRRIRLNLTRIFWSLVVIIFLTIIGMLIIYFK